MYNLLLDGFFFYEGRSFSFNFCIFFFWLPCVVFGVLVTQPGIEPGETQPGIPPAVEAWSPHHWTIRAFSVTRYFTTSCRVYQHEYFACIVCWNYLEHPLGQCKTKNQSKEYTYVFPKLNLWTYSYRASWEGTVEIAIFKNVENKLMITKGESRGEE